MRLRIFIPLFLIIWFTGCAAPHQNPKVNPAFVELQSYISTQKPLAQQGQMKWSDYYIGLIDRYNRAGAPADMVELMRQMLLNSQQMEKGVITADEYQYRQQDIRARLAAVTAQHQAQERAEQQAKLGLALQLMQSNSNAQVPMQAPYMLAPRNTSGQPVSQFQSTQYQPTVVATAFWTGKQTQVQTVTYQSGWNCEYNYAGRTFWRTFVGSCPSSVQVQ